MKASTLHKSSVEQKAVILDEFNKEIEAQAGSALMAGKLTIDRRDTEKRGDRIRFLKSQRPHDRKSKTFKACMKV